MLDYGHFRDYNLNVYVFYEKRRKEKQKGGLQ